MQASFDETNHFVHSETGCDCLRVIGVPLQQPIFEAREAEEIVFLFNKCCWRAVNWALTFYKFVIGEVGLARNAILALVNIGFDIAGVVASLQQLLHTDGVAFFGGANEIVVRDVEALPGLLEKWGDRVGKGLW